MAQTKKITGLVVDNESNIPIPGVNIIEKGTTNGTLTDFDGQFSIDVSDGNNILVISYLGYASQEIGINNQSNLSVALEVSASELSEVVVIGYGTQKKTDLTGAISTISSKTITELPVANVEQALQGRMTGVTVIQNASPGGTPTVRIRGIGTIGDNSPLYVVDGVQTSSLQGINPNDLESISVLKDASASAIYGSRAANGVVIVTTKRGGKNRKTEFTFSTYTGMRNASNKLDVLDAGQYIDVINESRNNANAQRTAAGEESLDPDARLTDPNYRISRTDWQDEIFTTGIVQDYQFGVTGGNETTNYAVSASMRDESGIIITTNNKRYTFRSSIDHKLNNKINFGSTISLSHEKTDGVILNDLWNGVLINALNLPENYTVKDADGEFVAPPTDNTGSIFGNANNPVGQATRLDNPVYRFRLLGNVYGEYDIINGLKLKSQLSIDYTTTETKTYNEKFPEGQRPITVSSLSRSYNKNFFYSWENTLLYTKSLGNHDLTLLGGTSAQEFQNDGFGASREEFADGDPESLRYLNFGSPLSMSNYGASGGFTLLSYFGRLTYSYKDKYLLNATVRRDGSSRFTEDKRWGTFPSISLGWKLSEENFLKESPWISNLKLRGSWGEVGNQSVNNYYPYVTQVSSGQSYNYAFGGNLVSGVAPSVYGNEDLSWETTVMSNIGLDFSILKNKIEFTAEYFNNDTKDMLLQVPLPQIIGQASVPNVNAGSVNNKGLELGITYRNTAGKLTYSISANASKIENEVTSLSTVDEIIVANDLRGSESLSRALVGYPIGSFFGYATDGIFQTQAEIDASPVQEVRTAPGDIKYKDLSGPEGVPDGIITADDRIILGDAFPDLTYSFNFSGQYEDFDLSIFLQGVSNVDVFNGIDYLILDSQGGNKSTEILNSWTPSNTNTDIPRLTWDDPNNNNRVSDRYIKDASYLRIKNVQLGYNFSGNILESLRLKRLRIYTSIENLLTLTNYNGYDPEVGTNTGQENGYGTDLSNGIDQGRYPQPRTFLLGLNITF
ncbi:SusC/RagA family TonB-linked outer membrane protein [Zobellia uliginosa]|uniref:SusC/RagA family TonB-linked outer membrane protein n=1 Tax=Zobellia uliginosa TaxID=143224 RepID=UPI001C06BC3F|nr:TonB-dependent receptor [Zobellia uliginosa]